MAPDKESQACLMRGPACRSSAQVPLEDCIPRRSRYGRLEQVGISVAEAVDAGSPGEVEDGQAIGQAHARTPTQPTRDGRKRQGAAPQALDLAHRAVVGAGIQLALLGLFLQCLDQRASGLAHARRLQRAAERTPLGFRHRLHRIGARRTRLALKFTIASDDAVLGLAAAQPGSALGGLTLVSFLRSLS
jgi:hypothetical protein